MLVDQANLDYLSKGLRSNFENGLNASEATYQLWSRIATRVASSGASEDYRWISQLPGMREWLGGRVVNQLSLHKYNILNRKFETTHEIPIDAIEDDQAGLYTMVSQQNGVAAREWPLTLVLEALQNGISEICYDGQFFFDTDHPVNGASVSNYTAAGGGQAWYLMDTTRMLKPLIFQERKAPAYWDARDYQQVEIEQRMLFGADARGNAGYGLWQTAYRSHAALDEAALIAVDTAMSAYTNDEGRQLGISPNLLVVGASNKHVAAKLLSQERLANGESNYLRGQMDLLVIPQLP